VSGAGVEFEEASLRLMDDSKKQTTMIMESAEIGNVNPGSSTSRWFLSGFEGIVSNPILAESA
jgi:hypothetical protein